jgi:hypothetical protein
VEADAFGRPYEQQPSAAQDTTMTDMAAMLGEWNVKLSETICAQADVILQLSKELTALRTTV